MNAGFRPNKVPMYFLFLGFAAFIAVNMLAVAGHFYNVVSIQHSESTYDSQQSDEETIEPSDEETATDQDMSGSEGTAETDTNESSIEQFISSDQFERYIVAFYTCIQIYCAVVFCIWIYRAFKNLADLRRFGLKTSPGLAVGSYFIPFLNFYMPYKSMRELWNASTSDTEPASDSSGYQWDYSPETILLTVWWSSFIAAKVLDRLYAVASKNTSSDLGSEESIFGIILLMLYTTAALSAGIIVKEITDSQNKKHEILSEVI